MVSKFDIIKIYRKIEETPEKQKHLKLNADETALIDRIDGHQVCTLDDYLRTVRKEMHCNFSGIYYDPASLLDVMKCEDCGTIIFSYDDERYDHCLCCPVCGNYKTYFEYWTVDDIENDSHKKDTLKFYQQITKERAEDYAREKRTGLYFDELWKHRTKMTKDRKYKNIKLKRNDRKGIKGMYLEIEYCEPDEECPEIIIRKRRKEIPLSISAAMLFHRIKKHQKEKEDK